MGEAWSVSVEERGREGVVRYRDSEVGLSFPFEFGGGEALALISVGTAEEWAQRHPRIAARRTEILERIGVELLRQRAPACRAVMDEGRGCLQILGSAPAAAPLDVVTAPRPVPPRPGDALGDASTSDPQAKAAAFMRRLSSWKAKMALTLGLGALAFALLAWLARSFLSVETIGTPIGASARAGDAIATLVQRLEPYVPSLHRDPSRDRYSLGLLLHGRDEAVAPRWIPIASGLEGSAATHAKFLGDDGTRLWFRAPEIGAYDHRVGRLLTAEELRKDPRAKPPERAPAIEDYAAPERALLLFLSACASIDDERWLAVRSAHDAESEHRLGGTAPRTAPCERSADPRALYVGKLARQEGRAILAEIAVLAGDPLWNGGFVRAERNGAPLLLADPPGVLLLHESQRYRAGTSRLARLDRDGRALWSLDLGLGELLQILPDAERPAFVGTRPKVPDQVPEPLLVVVDVRTGRARTHSLLWRG